MSDCFGLLVGLREQQAQQENKIRHLKDDLRVKVSRRSGFKREVEDWCRTQDRAIAAQGANRCMAGPEIRFKNFLARSPSH